MDAVTRPWWRLLAGRATSPVGGGGWHDRGVRLTEFWRRMRAVFGDGYADSWARDTTLAALDGRTVAQALSDGVPAKRVWHAVCQDVEVPSTLR
jgi:hypothetical protein